MLKSYIINYPQASLLPYWQRKWRHTVCSRQYKHQLSTQCILSINQEHWHLPSFKE